MSENLKYKVLIVDDESLARQLVRGYISQRNDIEVVGECKDGFECLKFITEHKVDILFLDVQMPKINGFELLEVLREKPHVVFTTAFDEYAIKAFEMNAVDYLLKPFSKERLFEAVEKCISRIKLNENKEINTEKLSENYAETIDRIVVRQGAKLVIVPVDDIIYLESSENYVKIKTHNGSFLKEKTMKYFEEHLPKKDFVRLHRSYIVKLTQILSIEPYTRDSYIATLKNNEKIKVSQEGYKSFRTKLGFV